MKPEVGRRVQIRPLNQHQIDNFPIDIGFVESMKMCFGRTGVIDHVSELNGPSYTVSLDSITARYNWPLSSLILLANEDEQPSELPTYHKQAELDQRANDFEPVMEARRMLNEAVVTIDEGLKRDLPEFPAQKETDMIKEIDRGLAVKHKFLTDFVKAAEAKEPNRMTQGIDTQLRADNQDRVRVSELKEERMEKEGGYDRVLYGRVEAFERSNGLARGRFFVFYKAESVPFTLRESDTYSDNADLLIRTMMSVHMPVTNALHGVILVLDANNRVTLVRNEL